MRSAASVTILFSHDNFSMQKYGGISRYFLELAMGLSATGVSWHLWAGRHKNAFVADAQRQPWAAGRITAGALDERVGRGTGGVPNEFAFRAFVKRTRPAIVHRTYHPVVDLLPRGVNVVETLHDMMDERWLGDRRVTRLPRTLLKRRALSRANTIVCVSQSTLDELRACWPDLAARAVVIHHGVRPLEGESTAGIRSAPYFLFVGERGRYKNFRVALKAFGLLKDKLADHELICFGGRALEKAELDEIATLGLTGRVHHIGGGDAVLKSLYENAAALLYPSAYEGFGMPLLEAMIHGCPAIAAPLTSLPEVGGDAVLYADPNAPEEWTAAMEMLAECRPERERLIEAGRARCRRFSWEAAAVAYKKLYDGLA
jgi:glycosyltransferase involved in cell wall biosynthesis